MKLNLRCACCDRIVESKQDTDELIDADVEDICPHCFLCPECEDSGEDSQPIKNDSLGFLDAAIETHKRCGAPPLIGTFSPVLGDIGRDADGNFWVWEGQHWIHKVQIVNPDGSIKSVFMRAKTFEEWMGLKP